jgi:hypothetical protein
MNIYNIFAMFFNPLYNKTLPINGTFLWDISSKMMVVKKRQDLKH